MTLTAAGIVEAPRCGMAIARARGDTTHRGQGIEEESACPLIVDRSYLMLRGRHASRVIPATGSAHPRVHRLSRPRAPTHLDTLPRSASHPCRSADSGGEPGGVA